MTTRNGVLDAQRAAVLEHHLLDDRQAEARPGHRPGRGRPEEPVENERPFLRRNPGAVIGDHQLRVRRGSTCVSRTPTVPPGGLHFAALSRRLSTARASPAAIAVDLPRRDRDVEVDVVAAPANPLQDRSTTSAMSTVSWMTSPASSRVRSTRSPTSVDNSSICAMTSVAQPGHLLVGKPRGARLHDAISSSTLVRSDVSGRSQLVAGVGDQPRLPLPRLGERPQHHVESLGEAGEFVAAIHRYRAQVVGTGHPFGRLGEPGDRAQTRRGRPFRRRSRRPPRPIPPTMSSTVPNRLSTLPGRRQALRDQQRVAVVRWTASTR